MSEASDVELNLGIWTAVKGAPDWKRMVHMEGKKFRAQFHRKRGDRLFKHPASEEFMEMYKSEEDMGAREIFRKTAITLMAQCKKWNKGVDSKVENSKSIPLVQSSAAPSKLSKSKKPVSRSAPAQASGESSSSSSSIALKENAINDGLDKQLKELGPEPTKGAVGTNQRWEWTSWNAKKTKLEAEAKDKAKKAHSRKSKTTATTKTKVATKAKPKLKPRAQVKLKSKPAVQADSVEMEMESEVDEEEVEQEVENEFSNFRVATRAPSKNAKGHSRRLGKGKRSSDDGSGNVTAEDAGSRKAKTRRTTGGAGGTTHQEMNTMNPVLPGAAQLFQAQRTGSKGLRAASKANSGRESLMPTPMVYQSFLQVVHKADPLYDSRRRLQAFYLKHSKAWLWQLQLNHNLLFFGIGCKRKLLEQFAEDSLDGEDVLMIDGSMREGRTGNRTIRAMLDTICTNKLKIPTLGANCLSLDSYVAVVIKAVTWHYHRRQVTPGHYSRSRASLSSSSSSAATKISTSSSSTVAMPPPPELQVSSSFSGMLSVLGDDDAFSPRSQHGSQVAQADEAIPVRLASVNEDSGLPDTNWGGRYAHALPKLYIVVNAIDGIALQSAESQRALAALAECPAVSLVASADKLNAPLLWSNKMLDQYRWYYVHTATYESHALSPDFALLHNSKGTTHIQASALETILNSLTPRHKEIFTLLAKESLREGQDNARGVPFDQLLERSMKAMLVTTSVGLNNYLKEFADHKVILKSTDANKKEWVRITLPRTTIEQMLQS